MAPIDLVIGSTGAGKSTYARKLAEQQSRVRFALDEWMVSLFGVDRPENASFDWYSERISRCHDMMLKQLNQLQRLGVGAVLEIGLTQRQARTAFCARLQQSGWTVKLHVIEAPKEARWQRVKKRNAERGETYSLHVSREMFDFVETMWEPPTPVELATLSAVVVCNDSSRSP